MDATRTSRRRPRRALAWFGWWVALMAMWLVLVGTLDPVEAIVGAAAAAVAATAAVLVLLPGADRFESELRWLLRLWRLPWQALLDTGVLVAALWRHLVRGRPVRGRFRALPFEHGGQDPESTARRACTKAAGSFAGNAYVVGIDAEEDLILFHELLPTDGRQACDPLSLG